MSRSIPSRAPTHLAITPSVDFHHLKPSATSNKSSGFSGRVIPSSLQSKISYKPLFNKQKKVDEEKLLASHMSWELPPLSHPIVNPRMWWGQIAGWPQLLRLLEVSWERLGSNHLARVINDLYGMRYFALNCFSCRKMVAWSSQATRSSRQVANTPLDQHPKPRMKSKRFLQRRKKRYKKTSIDQFNKPQKLKQALHLTQCCLNNFGFCANPEYSIQKKLYLHISQKPLPMYAQPKNRAFHNLCDQNKLPIGTRQLLGLNLNFYLATKNIKNNINKTILKMAWSIRISFFLRQYNLPADKDYEKQIYICDKNWHLSPAPLLIEEKITEFEKLLKEKQQKLIAKGNNRYLLT
jgi:hypothetical protein